MPRGSLASSGGQGGVLFCALSLFSEVGGIQRFNQRVVKAMAKDRQRDDSPRLVLSLIDRARADGSPEVSFIGCGGSRVAYVGALVRCLLKYRPSILLFGHINLLPLTPLCRMILPRVTTVLFVHGIEVWNDARYRARPWYESWLVRHGLDRVISVSQFTADVMRREYHLHDLAVDLLPNAVDIDPSPVRPAHPRHGGQPPRLLSVTRLADRDKGVGRVIEALARLRPHFPNLEYHIVGTGPLKDELVALARKLGIAHAVRFHGQVSDIDLAAAYRSADVFVLPSAKEGFGIVFLEAWQHGLPVICGNADASPEVVRDDVSGILVDPYDVDALARAIRRVLEDPALAERLASNGFDDVRRDYAHRNFEARYGMIMDGLRAASRQRA